MSTRVKSHTRKTKSGKTITVKAHEKSYAPKKGFREIGVRSSFITGIGYNPDNKVLEITFGSRRYRYYGVSKIMATKFENSESKGVFFHSKIKGEYRFREYQNSQ